MGSKYDEIRCPPGQLPRIDGICDHPIVTKRYFLFDYPADKSIQPIIRKTKLSKSFGLPRTSLLPYSMGFPFSASQNSLPPLFLHEFRHRLLKRKEVGEDPNEILWLQHLVKFPNLASRPALTPYTSLISSNNILKQTLTSHRPILFKKKKSVRHIPGKYYLDKIDGADIVPGIPTFETRIYVY